MTSTNQMHLSYRWTTAGVIPVSLTLQYISPHAFIGRLVPFAAVAAANTINIPLMRYRSAHVMPDPQDSDRS